MEAETGACAEAAGTSEAFGGRTASSGRHAGTPRETQTPYLRDFLAFIGLDRVEFVYAEGLNLGDDHRQAALARAETAIERLVAPALAAA